ncbi:hypothetical protein B0H14DRAFT_3090368 [Mycena olivaceomarginata]|nr:hypothetical protein B0H14DRAFT_3090368 [Mycena olivaceomarginata]
MFMLDLLDNLPRLRLSNDQLKSIIWVMRECGTPNVPNFSALRKRQAAMTREININSQHHTSSLGNHFYMNHPAKLLSLDWGNPLVRPFIHLYPDVSGPVSESWQAAKWTEEIGRVPYHNRHYYIKELAQLTNGHFVIPLRWVTVNNVVHADIFRGDSFHILTGHVHRIPAKTLQSNYLDLCKSYQIQFTEYSPQYEMPHLLRKTAKNRPIFRLRVMPWSDDVSGNVSKQYNAHTNIYISNLNLPHQKLSQEYFVRFCSTSPHASSSEQFVALAEDFKPGVWNEAYDCELEEEILFEVIPHVLPADNPQQSETSSHIGMGGSLGCRRDLNGGSKEQRETDDGYHAMYLPGKPRELDSTIQVIRWQLWMACLGNKSAVEESQTLSGIKDKIAQHWISSFNDPKFKGVERSNLTSQIKHQIQQDLRTSACDLKPGIHYNILLQTRGIDPHQDTPGEILHTYLLGNDKYVWHDTSKSWDLEKGDLFAGRLEASFLGGLSIPPPRPRYVVQYKNSLIGKHFKMLQQLAVFHVHDLCSPLVFDLWKATGELGALLWYPVIKDMDLYLDDLKVFIDNLLDIWGLVDPNRILVKGKLHVLTHLVSDARRFGPSVLYATEIYECWNTVFRLCSILSNHLAPSRDIAVTLADMERFKYMVSGGWWKDKDGKYVQAGVRVASFLRKNKELQRRLGWCEQIKPEPVEPSPGGRTWVHAKYIASQSGDCCCSTSWVFFKHAQAEQPLAGRIVKIVSLKDSNIATAPVSVVIEPFTVLTVKDKGLNMPVLIPSMASERYICVGRMHDCITGECHVADIRTVQERILTEITQSCVKHTDMQRYILNMHGLHNTHLIREVLPRSLVAPIPYLPDPQLRIFRPRKACSCTGQNPGDKATNKRKRAEMEIEQADRQKNVNAVEAEPEENE